MKKSVYILFILGGAIMGIFILFPVNEAIYYYEHIRLNPNAPTLKNFILDEFAFLQPGKSLEIPIFYLFFGALLAFIITRTYSLFAKNVGLLQQVSEELGKNVAHVIDQGEGPLIEFKSSFRWDFQQSKMNRDLETVVLKTIAGFMNSAGGSLLIGVADDKQILGLGNDYQTLKKPNRDGFERAIMTSVSSNLGTDLCRHIHIIFHVIDNADICRVIVMPSNRPVYLKHEGKLKLFVRIGGSTRELNLQEAVEYITTQWTK